MALKGLLLRFIRFLGPGKQTAEFAFAPGLNILWGSSDTGKTFLVGAIDFMLGAGSGLKDIPERVGYESVLLGLTTVTGKDYTIHRSINGGSFRRYDGLLSDLPANPKAGKALSAVHTTKNYNNLSHWLLQEIGLDNKQILWSRKTGDLRSLGFRALAHLCVVAYPKITQVTSPLYGGQYHDETREYGVFKLLLTGNDDSSVTAENAIEALSAQAVELRPILPETLEHLATTYEDDLAKLTDNPEGLDGEESAIDEQLEKLQTSLRSMEGQISETTRERKDVYDNYALCTARSDEITELQSRFQLLDQQYTNDLKRLVAIKESGQFFVLRDPSPCPLCGALPEGQRHDSACDGNVAAVAQSAAAEITKIKLLQTELQETVVALTKEHTGTLAQRRTLEAQLRRYQEQIDAALSPEFGKARNTYEELIEKRASIRQAVILHKKLLDARRRLDEPTAPPEKPVLGETSGSVEQYISKTVLRAFSKTVEKILQEWHFPDATDVYFDEVTRDIVIGGRPRGSRGSGLCAITYSAFIIGLFEYCRSRKMAHPGFVILDSPLLAYKEPKGEDEGIAGTDLKLRFYEHLEKLAGRQQVFVVDNTEPPENFRAKAQQFTHNPEIPRYGLFPHIEKTE
jgi:hypothetical protein